MVLRVKSQFKSTVVIDGEVIPIKIKRFNPTEAVEFNRTFAKLGEKSRLPELGPDATLSEIDERQNHDDEIERSGQKFVVQAISDFVEFERGYIVKDDDEGDVVLGADFVQLFGARSEVLSEILLIIYMENRLDSEQKSNWKTRLAPFVPSSLSVANRMMELGEVNSEDVVYDLGCGNGILCIAAAKKGAHAHGWDIDAERIGEAKAAAKKAGVSDLCHFIQGDVVKVDLTKPTVVCMYLLQGANIKLRPRLLQELPNGARVLTHAFPMGADWQPDITEDMVIPEGEKRAHSGQYILYKYSVDSQRGTK
jgi:hypothetical protein